MGWAGLPDHHFARVLDGAGGVRSRFSLGLSNRSAGTSTAPVATFAPYARRAESEGETADDRASNRFSLPILRHTAAGRDKRQMALSWVRRSSILDVEATRCHEQPWSPLEQGPALH